MPEEKVSISAKIPFSLHTKLLESVKTNRFPDKTDCIIKGLSVILGNTQQETSSNTTILQDEILVLRSDLQNSLSKIEELQTVIRELPDPALLRAREEVLQVLLTEKDLRIKALENNLRDLKVFAYKPAVQERNTEVIPSNTLSEGLIKKLCPQCGNPFETGNNRRIYCSSSCNTAACRKRKKTL